MYAASLAAAVAFNSGGEEALQSWWLECFPLLAVPAVVLGFLARLKYERIGTMTKQNPQAHAEPADEDEDEDEDAATTERSEGAPV